MRRATGSLDKVLHLDRLPYRAVGRSVAEVRKHFKLDTKIVTANTHFHVTTSTCSRCMQSAHEGQIALWKSPYHILRGTWSGIINRIDIITGQVEHIPSSARGRLVCYGECARQLAEQYDLLWIPGCPPSVDDFLKIF